jgi:hypothetical protein
LIATIKEVRPDLLQEMKVKGEPIPSTIPQRFLKPIHFIEGVGEPILACFLKDINVDATGWFVSFGFNNNKMMEMRKQVDV